MDYKIDICSDLHLEFGKLHIDNVNEAKVLVLAGDILVANHITIGSKEIDLKERYLEFFRRVSKIYEDVILIMGNHEHYYGDISESYYIIKEFLETNKFNNVHLLDNESVEIKGVEFFGSTLWTDINKSDPLSISTARFVMCDYRAITNKKSGCDVYYDKLFSPHAAINIHEESISKLNNFLSTQSNKKRVIITHHLPCKLSIPDRFSNEISLNGSYYSDLSDIILDNKIDLWVHGHTHDFCDYILGETRVVCNPRGYFPTERSINYKPFLISL